MKHVSRFLGILALATLFVALSTSMAFAANMAPVDLGTALSYGLFATGGGIGSNPDSTCKGDAGLWDPSQQSIGGVTPQLGPVGISGVNVIGATHVNDSIAATVSADVHKAWDDAWGRPAGTLLLGETSGTLLPGVYDDGDSGNTIIIAGTLTLDAQGDPEAVFIFRTSSTFRMLQGARIVLANGARFCRVFVVGDWVEIGPNATFVGHAISGYGTTVGSGATINGQLLAGTVEGGNITLSGNTITNGPCTPRLPRTGYPPAPVSADLPIALCAIAAMALVLVPLRRRAFDI